LSTHLLVLIHLSFLLLSSAPSEALSMWFHWKLSY
jgi:hypothetical protein